MDKITKAEAQPHGLIKWEGLIGIYAIDIRMPGLFSGLLNTNQVIAELGEKEGKGCSEVMGMND